jgi:hypothetical protein
VEGEPLDLDRYERWVKDAHEAAARGLTSLSHVEEHALALVAALRAERAKKCAAPGVAMCAKEWQADHQALQLAHYGLDAEFAHDGCDAIGSVAAALVGARERASEWEAACKRAEERSDELTEEAMKINDELRAAKAESERRRQLALKGPLNVAALEDRLRANKWLTAVEQYSCVAEIVSMRAERDALKAEVERLYKALALTTAAIPEDEDSGDSDDEEAGA